jgi:hypothetical protein
LTSLRVLTFPLASASAMPPRRTAGKPAKLQDGDDEPPAKRLKAEEKAEKVLRHIYGVVSRFIFLTKGTFLFPAAREDIFPVECRKFDISLFALAGARLRFCTAWHQGQHDGQDC